MERDFGAEIDSLKDELKQIRKWIIRGGLVKQIPEPAGEGPEVLAGEDRRHLGDIQARLLAYTDANHATGAVAYTGTFVSGDDDNQRQSMWTGVVRTDDLLKLNDNRVAEKVLASVGNGQRLNILLALLKKPQTVNQLVEALGANTTGQVYHHLKPLVAADIVKEEKGVYAVIPHRVQGIVMLLAGVQDLIDNRYTSGTWEE